MILFKICIGERKKNFFLRGGERKNIFWGERRRKENYYFLGERSERKNIEAEGKNFLLLEFICILLNFNKDSIKLMRKSDVPYHN